MRASAILLAAGRGTRLGDGPKAFLELGGRSMLEHAVEAALRCDGVGGLVVTVPAGTEERAVRLLDEAGSKNTAVLVGGETRQASVRRALDVLGGAEVVVVHDVARPFATPALFGAVLDAVDRADGAVPVVPVADTVKRTRDGSVAETVSRDGLVLVQTPQAFRREALVRAHDSAVGEGFRGTDDAALLERAGFTVATVPGDPANIKVTTARDLELARALASTLLR